MEESSEEQKVEIPNWENIAKYKAAELENYIKRQKDAVQNAYNDGRINTLMKLLPLNDTITTAVNSFRDESVKQGLNMLIRKFESIIADLGVEEIAVSVGDTFDPYIHECVNNSEVQSNTVSEVYQKGYKFAGRIIRPAMVKI